MTVQHDDYATGKTIAELDLFRLTVAIRALRRGEIRGEHPSPEMRLRAGDILILESQVDKFQPVINFIKTGSKNAKNSPS